MGARIESVDDRHGNSSSVPDEFGRGDVALKFLIGIDRQRNSKDVFLTEPCSLVFSSDIICLVE